MIVDIKNDGIFNLKFLFLFIRQKLYVIKHLELVVITNELISVRNLVARTLVSKLN